MFWCVSSLISLICHALLHPDPNVELNATVIKFVELFSDELESVVNSGGLDRPAFLCAACTSLRDVLEVSTQEVESTNKMIQNETDRAPQMSMTLLASRITQKKALFAEAGSACPVLTHDIVRSLAAQAASHYGSDHYTSVWRDPQRFVQPAGSVVPTPLPNLPALADAHSIPSQCSTVVAQEPPSGAPSAAPRSAAHTPASNVEAAPRPVNDSEIWSAVVRLKWSWRWDKSCLSSRCADVQVVGLFKSDTCTSASAPATHAAN